MRRRDRAIAAHSPGRIAELLMLSLAIFAAIFASLQLAERTPILGLAPVLIIVGAIWLSIREESTGLPARLVLLLSAMTFSTILPPAAALPVQALALGGAFLEWFAHPARRGTAVVFWSAVAVALWLLLVLHPNVPGVNVGLLGARKSVLLLGGVVLGCAVPAAHRRGVERLVVALLTTALIVSIGVHLLAPQFEASISRGASEYTAMIAGQARLQGVFAGPFHVATAGVFLTGWATSRMKEQRGLALLALSVGAASIYLSLVRTAYVAVLVVVLVLVLAATNTGTRVTRMAQIGIVAGVAVLIAANSSVSSETLGSILNAASDTRLQNRLPGYQRGIALFWESPLYGWGAGSAGDTLGDEFLGRRYTTAHNILLKIAVEAGVLGLFVWGALIGAVLRQLDRRAAYGEAAIVGLVALATMGVATSSLETIPVSYLLMVIVGLGVGSAARPAQQEATQSWGV